MAKRTGLRAVTGRFTSRRTICVLFMGLVIVANLLDQSGRRTTTVKASPLADINSPLVVFAYGDTRTGWWGLGSNFKQNTHGRMVDAMLSQDQHPKAVIFNGDAVMTNFFLWKGSYWNDFLRQTNKFVLRTSQSIGFYPSMGNHEAETNKPVLMQAFEAQIKSEQFAPSAAAVTQEAREDQIGDEFEKGEDDYGKLILSAATPTEQGTKGAGLLLNKRESQRKIKKLGQILDKAESGDLKKQINAAYFLGAAGAAIQQEYYSLLAEDKGCGKDPDLLQEAYIRRAKYGDFLNRVLPTNQSFYSVVLSEGNVSLKLIALDTNCLISKAQQDFFERQLANFSGPIVVYGHHPPVDETLPAPYWDKPPGIEFLRNHFEDKRIRLWIFGHVHNYQRRNRATSGDVLPTPVLLISGGGGASLKKDGANYNQWQPKDWPEPQLVKPLPNKKTQCEIGQPCILAMYHFIRLAVTQDEIVVDVFGAAKKESAFQEVDHFSIKLN
jgi:hypothetical protein